MLSASTQRTCDSLAAAKKSVNYLLASFPASTIMQIFRLVEPTISGNKLLLLGTAVDLFQICLPWCPIRATDAEQLEFIKNTFATLIINNLTIRILDDLLPKEPTWEKASPALATGICTLLQGVGFYSYLKAKRYFTSPSRSPEVMPQLEDPLLINDAQNNGNNPTLTI